MIFYRDRQNWLRRASKIFSAKRTTNSPIEKHLDGKEKRSRGKARKT